MIFAIFFAALYLNFANTAESELARDTSSWTEVLYYAHEDDPESA